jgi:hypothetical protein
MSRLLSACCILAIAAALATVAQAADKPIKVFIDNQQRTFNPPAITRNGKAFLPMRAFAGAIQAGIKYDPAAAIVKITYCSKTAWLRMSDGITVNGSFYVPLRTVANALALQISWNASTSSVYVDMAGSAAGAG